MSGGPDSVAMLLKYHNDDCCVIHFDHGIRSNSAEDAQFVKNLSNKLGVPCDVHKLKLGSEASENDARQARLRTLATYYPGNNVFYIAHNMDDVAETVLFNLFRGSGVFGSCSLKKDVVIASESFAGHAVNLHIHRPMLNLRKKDILSFLEESSQDYCVDSTNNTDLYTRNIIRNKIIPMASAAMDRDVVPTLYKFSQNAQELNDMLESVSVDFVTDDYIDCIKYSKNPTGKHHLIKLLKSKFNTSRFTKKHWDAIDAALKLGASTRISLPGVDFIIRKKKAKFDKRAAK